MEANEIRLVALVNLLTDAAYPNPDDSGPIGPWGPWIREALKDRRFPQHLNGPLPEPWGELRAAGMVNAHWWQDDHPGPPPYWKAALADLAGHFVDDLDQPGPKPPRPNWRIGLLLRDLASLNPQPLPPVDGGIGFARSLADVALRGARGVGGEQGSSLLLRFAEDWCGNSMKIPTPPKPVPGEPRPPRPEESLVLGASLIRAAGSVEFVTLKKAAEEAGRQIFEHGLSALASLSGREESSARRPSTTSS